jgi:putative ubiquitin-RnfH superfamily antitoxin RatB of RatAB toxin-antitoxin module
MPWYEVAYALPERQTILVVESDKEMTAEAAVNASGIFQLYPDIDPDNLKLGIFGKITKADTVLNEGDRVEIYRPLIADPKEARKKRAAEGKSMKKGQRE